MAAAFFNTPEKSVVSLFHDPPGVCLSPVPSATRLHIGLDPCRLLCDPLSLSLGIPSWAAVLRVEVTTLAVAGLVAHGACGPRGGLVANTWEGVGGFWGCLPR